MIGMGRGAAGVFLSLGIWLHGSPARGQSSGSSVEVDDFVRRAVEATRSFRSQELAIRAGYRRLGPDFPGMGEHWVNPGLAVRGVVDPERPSVLSYVEIDGEPVLVGLAFTVPLSPDEEPPSTPFGREAWHDHSGAVDEETLLLNHPASVHGAGAGYRLSMVHVWTEATNPDGILAQNNWTIPYLRVGLAPPRDVHLEAARGVSLAYRGRRFYSELLSRAADLTPEEEAAIGIALDRSAARVEREIQYMKKAPTQPSTMPTVFAEIWRDFWVEVESVVRPEVWTGLSGLAAEGARDPITDAHSPGAMAWGTADATPGAPEEIGRPR